MISSLFTACHDDNSVVCFKGCFHVPTAREVPSESGTTNTDVEVNVWSIISLKILITRCAVVYRGLYGLRL